LPVTKYESELRLEFLKPDVAELILDVGCGTGVFTRAILAEGSRGMGLGRLRPMPRRADQNARG